MEEIVDIVLGRSQQESDNTDELWNAALGIVREVYGLAALR